MNLFPNSSIVYQKYMRIVHQIVHQIHKILSSLFSQKSSLLKSGNIGFQMLLVTICGLIIISSTTASGFEYTTSWVGNTIGKGKLRVQNNIEAHVS